MPRLELEAHYSATIELHVCIPVLLNSRGRNTHTAHANQVLSTFSLPVTQFTCCRGFPKTTKRNNTRIRLLVNCHGLETDTCRFRTSPQDDTCRLCRTAREDALHFISHCPALSSARDLSRLSALAPLLTSDPLKFTEHLLGTSEWIDDPPLQSEIVEFVYRLHTERLLKLSLPTQ